MHIHLRVGESTDGAPAFEPVHLCSLGGSRYRVEFTPGLAYDIAAGDEVEVAGDGSYSVVARAGNIAVRVFSTLSLHDNEPELTAQVEDLGGRLDGRIDRGLAYTIPFRAGFPVLESVFDSFTLKYPTSQWEYGNIYAEDGSPLNWWQTMT
jgi:hypothetical protein